MKIILSLLILISLFSYLLAGTFSCPSFFYICCSSDSSNTCKCVPYSAETETECKLKVKCNDVSKSPVYTEQGKNVKSTCIN